MKCISVWNPWAYLMAIGAKENETRGWATNYRGPLAIHAAKKWNHKLTAMCYEEQPFHDYMMPVIEGIPGNATICHKAFQERLAFGAIVAIVNLCDCVEITADNAPMGDELAFGDYTPGRFMWRTADRIQLPKPIPFKGRQGLFDVPDELLREYIK